MGVLSRVGEFLTARDVDVVPAVEERSWALAQLGIGLLNAYPGALGVSSIDEALRDAATWQCVSVKAKNMASLPVDVIRYDGKTRVEAPMPAVISKPSALVSRRVWTFQAAASMFTDGNVFGLVTAVDSMARPAAVELLDPSMVTNRRVEKGVVTVSVQGVEHQAYPSGDLWFMPGEFVVAGSPFGLSPIAYGSKSIATALAAEAFGGGFFVDGGHPTWLLKSKSDPGKDGAKTIKEAFQNATRGRREPVVLPQSIEAEQISVNPNDSQFIDLMQFEVVQACRRHGVPPSMVFASVAGKDITYANVTVADLQFLKHTLSYPIDLFEDGLSEWLPRPRVVKYNREAILRGDAMSRWQLHDLRLKNKTTSINEVRTLEDEEPFTGDEYSVPGIPGGPETQGGAP